MRTALPPSHIVLHTSDTIVPYGSVNDGSSVREHATTSSPAHEWYLCKYYQFVFSIQYKTLSRNQTDRKANKEILFRSKLYSNPSACEYARWSVQGSLVAAIALIRCSSRCLIFTFILFISILFFLLSLTTLLLDVRRVFHFISSSFVRLVFRCHSILYVLGATRQPSSHHWESVEKSVIGLTNFSI